jgi:hypothetical protein
MNKTLGQIAYEAWLYEFNVPKNEGATWSQLTDLQREHDWEVPARALASYIIHDPANGFATPEMRAVIEAAKKWRTDLAFDEMTSENAYVLYAAIMDLEAAEKEER